jgi:hypothetical protein
MIPHWGDSGGVHHERLVESCLADQAGPVPQVHHRALGERGEQLVGRLRGEGGDPARRLFLCPHRMAAAIQRVKVSVGEPRLVEHHPPRALGQ